MSKGRAHQFAWLLAPALWLGLSAGAQACQPVIPMMMVTAPPTMMALMLTSRHGWLTLAALLVAVFFKSGVFAWFERDHLPPGLAFSLMVFGNLLSTVVGIGTTTIIFSGPGMGVLIGLFCGLPLALAPAGRLEIFLTERLGQRVSRYLLTLVIFFLLIMSSILFGMSRGELTDNNYLGYWLWKLAFVISGIAISLFLSALWEEYIIHRGYRAWGHGSRPDFVVSSLRANLYTMVIVGAMGAVMTLPERLRSPGFLIGLLERLVAALA